MPKNRYLQIRLTDRQYSLLQNKREYLGYKTLSQFVRDCIFKDELATSKLLQDIHKKLLGEDKNGKDKISI